MRDLERRLRGVDYVQTPAPDWPDIERRAQRPGATPSDRLVGPPQPTASSRRSRLAAAIVAAAVALGGFVFVMRAFQGSGDQKAADPSPFAPGALSGTSWVLKTIDGEIVVPKRWMTLSFSDDGDEFSATAECNGTGGSYVIDGSAVHTWGGGTTTVACSGEAAEREATYFATIRAEPTVEAYAATLRLTTGEHTIEFVQDPCSVLSGHDVAVATGVDVPSSEIVPEERMNVEGTAPICSYEVPGRFSSVSVSIKSASVQAFEAERDSDPTNTDVLDRIGDDAYIVALASISVFDEGRVISIGLQHGAGGEAVPVLEQLARAAVDAARESSATAAPSVSLTGVPEIAASIRMPDGGMALGLAVGADAVWLGTSDDHGENGRVLRIDPGTNDVVASISVQGIPARERIAATDDAVWVASTGLLERIDPATNSVVASVLVPDRAISAIAANGTDVWAVTTGTEGSFLVRVDALTNEVVAEIPLPPQISGYEDEVIIWAGSVWVMGVTWVPSEDAEYGSDLIRVDPSTNAVVAQVDVGGFSMVAAPDAIWVRFPADGVFDSSPTERWLWTRVDLQTNEPSEPFSFEADGLRLVTSDALWSVGYDESDPLERVAVTRFNPRTLEREAGSDPIASVFHDAVVDPATATVWVATLNEVVRVNISSSAARSEN